MSAIITARCKARAFPNRGLPVDTINRIVAGKGNACKSEVISALRDRGYPVAEESEADSMAILMTATVA